MGIPCIIGIGTATTNVADREQLLLDAIQGEVTPSPSDKAIDSYRKYQVEQQRNLATLEQYKQATTITQDGYEMKVFANITAPAEAEELLSQGGEGVGLLRTEMLCMEQRHAPDEDRQFNLSVSIPAITRVRRLINNLSQSCCQALLEHVIQMDTAAEVQAYLEEEQHGS